MCTIDNWLLEHTELQEDKAVIRRYWCGLCRSAHYTRETVMSRRSTTIYRRESIKDKVYADYLAGVPPKRLAYKYDLPYGTAMEWSTRRKKKESRLQLSANSNR